MINSKRINTANVVSGPNKQIPFLSVALHTAHSKHKVNLKPTLGPE